MRPTDRRTPVTTLFARALALLFLSSFVCSVPGCAWVRHLLPNPTEESRDLTERAKAAADSTNYTRANELLRRAGELTPDDPEIYRQQAETFLAQGNRRDAIEALSHAVEKDPDDVASRVQLSKLLIAEELPDLAEEPLDRALEMDPRHVEGLLLKAKLAENSGKQDVALETYHRVLGCDGEQVEARLALARLQASTGKWDRATPLLRAISECPRSTPAQKADAKWALGVAYGREQLWREAARELTEAAELRDNVTADDWYRIAYARLQAEDYESARSALATSLQKNSQHEQAVAMSAFFTAYGWGESRSMPQSVVPTAYTNAVPAPAGW